MLSKQVYITIDKVLSFASDYIYQRIEEKFRNELISIAVQKFNGSVCKGSEDCTVFEKLCLYTFPLTGKTIEITGLSYPAPEVEKGSDSDPVPITRVLEITNNSDFLLQQRRSTTLCKNVFYRPKICNLESGDAFMLDSQGDLYVFQMTIAATHSIKVNGLVAIVQAYLTSGLTITSKNLVFVTPIGSGLSTAQTLVTKANKVTTYLPKCIKGFQQWKIEYFFES